jgi:hypothetical protein
LKKHCLPSLKSSLARQPVPPTKSPQAFSLCLFRAPCSNFQGYRELFMVRKIRAKSLDMRQYFHSLNEISPSRTVLKRLSSPHKTNNRSIRWVPRDLSRNLQRLTPQDPFIDARLRIDPLRRSVSGKGAFSRAIQLNRRRVMSCLPKDPVIVSLRLSAPNQVARQLC